MPTQIVLTVKEGLTQAEINDLRYLLVDALGEFAAKRNDAKEYVEGRYPGNDYYPGALKDDKIEQVLRRVRLARKLHNAALSYAIDMAPVLRRAYDTLILCRRHLMAKPQSPLVQALMEQVDDALVGLL